MFGLDEARALLARLVTPLPFVELDAESAAGLRLALAPSADADAPAVDLAAVDGFAVRAADAAEGSPMRVTVVAAAGSTPQVLARGAAARVFTGAVIPEGADTVVAQEDAGVLADGTVRFVGVRVGANIRRRGEILVAGTPLARQWDALTPHRLGLLAAGGAAAVRVVPRPRLAIVSTGSELVGASESPAVWQVRDSNGPFLAAAAREAGLAVSDRRRVGDTLPELCACLEECARGADIVCTTGGVSAGGFDLVPAAVAELGGEAVVHRVDVRPGASVFVGRLGNAWLVGFPGGPAAVLTCWRMFARPLAEALSGDGEAFGEEPLSVVLVGEARNRGERTLLRPATLTARGGRIEAVVHSWHGSFVAAAAHGVNSVARLDPGAEVRAGESAACYPLPWKWPE